MFGEPYAAKRLWNGLDGNPSRSLTLKSTSVIDDAVDTLRAQWVEMLKLFLLACGAVLVGIFTQPLWIRPLTGKEQPDDFQSWMRVLVVMVLVMAVAARLKGRGGRSPDGGTEDWANRETAPTDRVDRPSRLARVGYLVVVGVASAWLRTLGPYSAFGVDTLVALLVMALSVVVIFALGRHWARRSPRTITAVRVAVIPAAVLGFGSAHAAALAAGAGVPYELVSGGPVDLVMAVWSPLLLLLATALVFGVVGWLIAPRMPSVCATAFGLLGLIVAMLIPVNSVVGAYVAGQRLAVGLSPTWYQTVNVRPVCVVSPPLDGPLPDRGGQPMWAWGSPEGRTVLSARGTGTDQSASGPPERTALTVASPARVVTLPPTACG